MNAANVKMDEAKQPPSESSLPKCYLCQSSFPTIKCEDCSNLVFCETCSVSYHNHQRRLKHKTKPLVLFGQDESSTPLAEEKPNLQSGQSLLTTQFSSLRSPYLCGCLQQWCGPDEQGRINPIPHCLIHNLTNAGTSGNKIRNGGPSTPTTFVAQSQSKVTDVTDQKPRIDDSIGTWVCEHCTYKNSMERKICVVCCKTEGVPTGQPVGAKDNTSQDINSVGGDDMHAKKDEKRAGRSSNHQESSEIQVHENHFKDQKSGFRDNENDSRTAVEDRKVYRKNSGGFYNTAEIGQDPTKTEDSTLKNLGGKFWGLFGQKKQTTSDHACNKQGPSGGQSGYSKQISIEKWIKKAEKRNFTRSDLMVAVTYDPDNPIQWLVDEWLQMIDNVVNIATNYGRVQMFNDVGILSKKEAKSALYLHKNVKDAVEECISRRQEGFKKLEDIENFSANKITDALSCNEGDVSAAYDYLVSIHIRSDVLNNDDTKGDTLYQYRQKVRPSPSSPKSSIRKERQIPLQSSRKNINDDDKRPTKTSGRKLQDNRIFHAKAESEEIYYDAEIRVPTEEDIDQEQLLNSLREGFNAKPELKELVSSMLTAVNQKNLNRTSSKASPSKSKNAEEKTTKATSMVTVTSESAPEASEADKKNRIRRFKADGLVSTNQQAVIASYLMELKFDESDAITAANACDSVDMAIGYLQQLCELCNRQIPMHKIFSMLNCPHRCCLTCASNHFKKVLKDGDILDAVCPVCHEPKLTDEKSAADYFDNLETLLTNLLDAGFHKLLREKLRSRTPVRDSKTNNLHMSRVRSFVAEGILRTPKMAEIASHLISMSVEESDAIAASKECSSVATALTYLQLHECPICRDDFHSGKMITMLNCEHRVCPECTIQHFSVIIKERSIMEAICPCCQEPNLNDDEVANQYFSNLQILLKNLIDDEAYKLFEQKLRDRALMRDPNFRWCQKCSSGFIADPNQTKAVCPDCKETYCAKCNRQWEKSHEGITCEQFVQWKRDNDASFQSAGLDKYLALYGLSCPKCKFRYELAKGGCMHFTCTQCKHQFCSGCGGTFRQAESCQVSPNCRNQGLHAHHPRSCLYYLRDWEHKHLIKLLSDNNVEYKIVRVEGDAGQSKNCPVLVQNEKTNSSAMEDAVCGKEVKEEFSGLCELHFVEYLVSVINKHGLDPVNLMSLMELQQELRRNEKQFPEGEDSEEYRKTLLQLILKEIPLDTKSGVVDVKPTG